MKKKVTIFAASFVFAMSAVFAYGSIPQSSCLPQCRVAFDKCVKQTNNPGGLNQCKRAFDACRSSCS